MAGVTFREVDKRYGDVAVIENLNLEIRDQEFMVLVGPSGCGKSTALRMVAGLEEISSGTISIGDRVVNSLPPKDRDIAMVFQNYALYPHMTTRQNLEFGLKMRGTPRDETARMVGDAAEILGLTPYLDRKPKQLSGGQRQRVAVGRAIVRHPSVFLFDEPLSNLDAKLRGQMRAEIKKIQHRLKTTTIYVTHDQVEAMTMGSRIAVMKDGRIQQVGTPLEIYGRPVNLFVAAFIGTPPMNFLPATVEGGSAEGDGFRLPVPGRLRSSGSLAEGSRVVLGLRPENILGPGEDSRGETSPLRLEVEVVEPLGDEVVVHGRVGAATVICKLDPRNEPEVGSALDAVVEVDDMHVFDAATERRLGD
ncbi:MAG TPA: sn-glycerol-3-phosphate ABC transporter ATP-binding protein UgpC [Thermoanaerobaculia bacterium]|nr:sn-glycerol-3-phosphate ABC transporter ATP-binding protein UgpC [Thermoanaerobaculia bacterium]